MSHTKQTDEQAIRDLVKTWMVASQAGDTEKVLSLMTDDVVFLVPGQEPFGKDIFKATSEKMKSGENSVRFEGTSDIEELKVIGEWAFARARLKVTTVPLQGEKTQREGYTLTIFQKENGEWKLARDANLLVAKK